MRDRAMSASLTEPLAPRSATRRYRDGDVVHFAPSGNRGIPG